MPQIHSMIRRIAAGLFALALVGGCVSSTRLTHVYQDPAYGGGPFKKIMVLGLGSEGAMSKSFEDIFVAELRSRGVDAVPGYLAVPEGQEGSREAIEQAARAAGADAFLVARLVKSEKETQYSPGYSSTIPAVGYYNNFYGFYSAAVTYAPAQTFQYEVVTVETNLWDVATNKLVWSGTSQTFAPGSVSQEAPGFAKLIINELSERKLLSAKP